MVTWQSKYLKYNMSSFLMLVSFTVGFFVLILTSPSLVSLAIFSVSALGLGLSYLALQERIVSEVRIEQMFKENPQLSVNNVSNYQLKGKKLLKIEGFHRFIENFTLVYSRGSAVYVYKSTGGDYAVVECFLWLKSVRLYEKE